MSKETSNSDKKKPTVNYEFKAANPNAVSRVAAGMTIHNGDITSLYDIRFDGCFDGKLTSKGRIIIGEGASLKCDVVCTNLDVWGVLEGKIFVKDTLSLKKGSSVRGSIHAGKLVVELGSRFEGDFKMATDEDYAAICKENDFLQDKA